MRVCLHICLWTWYHKIRDEVEKDVTVCIPLGVLNKQVIYYLNLHLCRETMSPPDFLTTPHPFGGVRYPSAHMIATRKVHCGKEDGSYGGKKKSSRRWYSLVGERPGFRTRHVRIDNSRESSLLKYGIRGIVKKSLPLERISLHKKAVTGDRQPL